jgi:hypothetical protein
LTASQINTLANDVQFLAGLAAKVNIPFQSIISGAGSGIDSIWMIRHTHRYLLYYLTQNASTSDSLAILYNGTTILNDGADHPAPYTWSGHIDLEDTGIITGISYGSWYQINLSITQKTGSGITQCVYLLESPNTTL